MTDSDLDRLLADAPGFGRCGRCPYLAGGSAALCHRCARQTIEPLAPPSSRCEVCDQTFASGADTCKNPVCGMVERWFEWNYAIAMRSGVLEQIINAYKYSGPETGDRGWAAVFGRILVGFLDAKSEIFRDVDLIVPSPTFVGPNSRRSWDHIWTVLAAADREQSSPARWPIDLEQPAPVVKVMDTARMTGMSYQERRANAEGPLRAALRVPDSSRTRGQQIAVFDDVFTDGLTLREVARILRRDGQASEVVGVTLARQPYGRP